MSKRDKINFFKSRTGIYDDNVAEHYLSLTNDNQNDAVKLYLDEKQVNQYNNPSNFQNDQPIGEFIVNDEILLNQETHINSDKTFYNDLITFFFEKFTYISTSLDNFLIQLQKHAGLIIILSKNTHFNARNDMLKVLNNQLCQDIIQNVVIFLVMNNSKIGNELLKKCNSSNFPLYLFCKYKNNYTINISYKLEQRFNDVSAVNYFLDCFPESDIRQSVFKNLNETVLNLRNSMIFGGNNINNQSLNNNIDNYPNINIPDNNVNRNNDNNNNEKTILADSKNYFDGNIDDLNRLIEKISKAENDINPQNISNNNIQNSLNNFNDNNIQPNNSLINNQSQNNINDINVNNSNNNNQSNSINNIRSQIDYNNSINFSNNNQSINQKNINNSNNINEINNRSQIQNSLNNQNIQDSIFGLSAGQINAKREMEMKELERQHEEKMKKEEEEKQKIINKENEIKLKNEQYEKEALLCKQNLPEEPEENNPNVCKIMFKYPSGEKTIERRFLKSDKIAILYNFVKSLGREIFSESNLYNFDLISGFPPKNLEDSKNKTLEEEGLFGSMIIIKEK